MFAVSALADCGSVDRLADWASTRLLRHMNLANRFEDVRVESRPEDVQVDQGRTCCDTVGNTIGSRLRAVVMGSISFAA